MTPREKIEYLKDTIVYLYEKEGRNKTYISKLLELNIGLLTNIINNEWCLIKADKIHFSPSKQKFLNKNKKRIIEMIDSDISATAIAKEFNISSNSLLQTYIKNDKELKHHFNMAQQRKKKKAEESKQKKEESSNSHYSYMTENDLLEGEIWKTILGYEEERYEVSNYARVRRWDKKNKKYYLIKPIKNKVSNRNYISLSKNSNRKNFILARIVAHAFVDGFSEINNTVDHINGDFENDKAENLQWVSQAENNRRAIDNGKKIPIAYSKNNKFKKIILDDKYEFKTIRALGSFLGVSETQAHRYVNGETKFNHKIKFIY